MEWPDELFVRRYDDLVRGIESTDDYELLKLAAGLRQLLLDEEPLLHRANRSRRLKIRFRVNRVDAASGLLDIIPDGVLFHAQGLDPLIFQTKVGAEEKTLDQFLSQNLIESRSGAVSVSDIIKFSANKIGGVHFDTKRSEDEARVERLLATMSQFGAHSLAIALRTITSIVLVGLRPLRDSIVKLPESFPLFAHYKLPKKGAIKFDGIQQFLETNLTTQLLSGFSLHAVMQINRQPGNGNRVVYEVGNADGSPQAVSLYVNGEGLLCARALLGASSAIEIVARNVPKDYFLRGYSYIGLDLELTADVASLSLYLEGRQAVTGSHAYGSNQISVSRHTIGSNLSGGMAAALELKELVLGSRGSSPEEREQIANYFWLQWHE